MPEFHGTNPRSASWSASRSDTRWRIPVLSLQPVTCPLPVAGSLYLLHPLAVAGGMVVDEEVDAAIA
jgi:hypothetical protein